MAKSRRAQNIRQLLEQRKRQLTAEMQGMIRDVRHEGRGERAADEQDVAEADTRSDIDLASDATLLVTMGCGDECPFVPGLATDDWPLPDPKNQPIDVVRTIRDDIRQRVLQLLQARGWARP